jgi:hypothetical protein
MFSEQPPGPWPNDELQKNSIEKNKNLKRCNKSCSFIIYAVMAISSTKIGLLADQNQWRLLFNLLSKEARSYNIVAWPYNFTLMIFENS